MHVFGHLRCRLLDQHLLVGGGGWASAENTHLSSHTDWISQEHRQACCPLVGGGSARSKPISFTLHRASAFTAPQFGSLRRSAQLTASDCAGSDVAPPLAALQDASVQTRELIGCNVILSASAGY